MRFFTDAPSPTGKKTHSRTDFRTLPILTIGDLRFVLALRAVSRSVEHGADKE